MTGLHPRLEFMEIAEPPPGRSIGEVFSPDLARPVPGGAHFALVFDGPKSLASAVLLREIADRAVTEMRIRESGYLNGVM